MRPLSHNWPDRILVDDQIMRGSAKVASLQPCTLLVALDGGLEQLSDAFIKMSHKDIILLGMKEYSNTCLWKVRSVFAYHSLSFAYGADTRYPIPH